MDKKNQEKEDAAQRKADQHKQQQELSLLVDDKEKEEKFNLDFQDDRFFNPIATDTRFSIDPTSKYFSKEKQKLLDFQVKSRKKVKK